MPSLHIAAGLNVLLYTGVGFTVTTTLSVFTQPFAVVVYSQVSDVAAAVVIGKVSLMAATTPLLAISVMPATAARLQPNVAPTVALVAV